MKKLLSVLLIILITGNAHALFPKAKMTVRVQDESGLPVANAKAKVYHFEANSKNDILTTDTNGQFVASGRCGGGMGGRISKDGFYSNGYGYGWKYNKINKIRNRYEPWNPTVTVVMKKKQNPIPMITKYTDWMKVPEFDKSIGYDLEVGDWVSPHGEGTHSDFLLSFTGFYKDRRDASLKCTLIFNNKKDGIQIYEDPIEDKSAYKWPFMAPEEGYKETTTRFCSYLPKEGFKTDIKNKDRKLIFRVRTILDKEGNILSANYGKIYQDIQLSRNGMIQFRYWFNQHGTRSLEDDPAKNIELKRKRSK